MNKVKPVYKRLGCGVLTLQRLKTGGRQTMIVQHVQVSDGGNALVAASVSGGSPSRKAFRGM
jgi:hypothetical protein